MKNHLRLATLMIGFLWASPAFTADFNAGLDAAKKGDYAAAFREFEPLIQKGYYAAQNNLGVMYRNELGVPKDYEQAVKWFTAAAQQGDASAQLNLSLMYYNGYGVRQNHVKGTYVGDHCGIGWSKSQDQGSHRDGNDVGTNRGIMEARP